MSTSPIARRIEVLSQIPLFSAFNRDELEALAGRFVDVSYRRGDTVCAEGDEGDTFFVCVSGELEVWGGAPRRIVNRLGPGEFFGEMSLLLGGQRAATVTASRNARLLAVDKAVFEQFFLHNAKVLEAFSRVLSKRLAKMARGEVIAKTSTTIGVTGAPGLEGKTLVATALARLLKEFSGAEVVLVQLEGGRAPGGGSAASLSELARASVDTLQRHLEDVGRPPSPSTSASRSSSARTRRCAGSPPPLRRRTSVTTGGRPPPRRSIGSPARSWAPRSASRSGVAPRSAWRIWASSRYSTTTMSRSTWSSAAAWGRWWRSGTPRASRPRK